MDLHTEDGLSAELDRILEETRRQLTEEFRRRAEAQRERDQASSREAVEAELREEFERTLQRTVSKLQEQSEQRMLDARQEWDEEKDRLRDQMNLWRTYADAQREMSESRSQAEILTHFLRHAESFAPNIAVYVAKADGLALWKTRGNGPFPAVLSQDTSDPENYFKSIIVREKTVAAVCARPPFSTDPLHFLAGCLERAIETFGARLQYRALKTVSS
jgi:chromosome segregation ATPase